MNLHNKSQLNIGHVVQLDPVTVLNKAFASCMMVITEIKPWGAMGYVHTLGENRRPGGQAYYRATWVEMEWVGTTVWDVE